MSRRSGIIGVEDAGHCAGDMAMYSLGRGATACMVAIEIGIEPCSGIWWMMIARWG